MPKGEAYDGPSIRGDIKGENLQPEAWSADPRVLYKALLKVLISKVRGGILGQPVALRAVSHNL